MGCHFCYFLLQGIFPNYGSIHGLLHCRHILYRWDLVDKTWDFPVVNNPPASAGNSGPVPVFRISPGGGNGNPLRYSCLTWWATVHRVAKSQTRLSVQGQMRLMVWYWDEIPLDFPGEYNVITRLLIRRSKNVRVRKVNVPGQAKKVLKVQYCWIWEGSRVT